LNDNSGVTLVAYVAPKVEDHIMEQGINLFQPCYLEKGQRAIGLREGVIL
jgi:hypothetical protein